MQGLADDDWDTLLQRIYDGKCTPVVGRGACSPAPPEGCDPAQWEFQYPLHEEMCRKWAAEIGYPFADATELDRVSQFAAIRRGDQTAAKEYVAKLFAKAKPPNFAVENEPHRVLAALPVPIYLTSNYDNFLLQALQQRRDKDKKPQLGLCLWNESLRTTLDTFDVKGDQPTVANPLIYHFLGCADHADSLVLTEDDQYEFLINLARDEKSLINHWVQRALATTSILFLGYTLRDRDFLLLFRLLGHFLSDRKRIHVAVQLEPETVAGDKVQALTYLNSYFDNFRIRVYWGDCKKFTAELWSRWQARPATPPPGP